MIYVMSDIHGEYGAYRTLLTKIGFSDSDELYVLGDCIDRGDEPIALLRDMLMRPNVFPLLGNHEYMALQALGPLMKEITEESCAEMLKSDVWQSLQLWRQNGGDVTLEHFTRLSMDERNDILEYLYDFSLYETVRVNGREFVLVHAGLENFRADRTLDDYAVHELIFSSPDYDRVYYADKLLVTGHLPTLHEPGNDGRIIMRNNNIAIDCGRVFGGRLAALRLDDLAEFYV